MKITLFFTKNISLLDWKNSGILDREIQLYKEMENKFDLKYDFITYGNSEDFEVINRFNIIPLNKNFLRSKPMQLLNLFLNNHKDLKTSDLFKTNQMNGAMFAIVLKILYRKKLILRMGYDWFNFAKLQKDNKFKLLFKYIYSFICLHFADLVIVSSNVDKARICKNMKINIKKIIVLENWIDTTKFRDLNLERKNEFLFVGRLEDQKNLFNTLELFENSQYKLNIVGNGKLKQDLVNFANSKNIQIEFYDNIDNDKLNKYYNKFKYFILNSKYEGNPKVLLEAMSSGCIVFCSDIEAHQEIIVENLNGFYVRNKQEFLNNLEMLENKLFDENQIKNESINRIIKTNSLESYVEKEYQNYKKTISKR